MNIIAISFCYGNKVMQNKDNKTEHFFLFRKAAAFTATLAFICSLFFADNTFQERFETNYSSSVIEIAQVTQSAFVDCSCRSHSHEDGQVVATAIATPSPSVQEELKELCLKTIFCGFSKTEFLDLTRSYQFVRLNVLQSQAHPPTSLI